jgi:hypothetical protein
LRCWSFAVIFAKTAAMNEAESEVIFSIEEAPEGGFVARALGYSIFTEADDLDALRNAVRDAVRCHFDEADRPKVIRLHFVREEVFAA